MFCFHLKKPKTIVFLLCLLFVFLFSASPRMIPANTKQADGIPVPIIMYHSIVKDSQKSGTYVITPMQLESDFLFLKEHGYTTVLISDLIHYAHHGIPLPEKPVVLTFDDGHLNQYTILLPLLEKYDAKAVISIVGEYTDFYTQNPDEHENYAYLSWEHCRALLASGRVELQNHSDKLHHLHDTDRKGSLKKSKESTREYQNALYNDLECMQQKMETELSSVATAYTYPFGCISPESASVIRAIGFRASLSCNEGINYLSRNPEQLFLLRRCLRSSQRSIQQIFSQFQLL